MVRRVMVLLLLLCGIAACSRQSPPQESTAASQPPATAPAASQPEAPQQPAEPPPPTPAAADSSPPPATAPPSSEHAASKLAPGTVAAKPAPASPPLPQFRAITVPAETPLTVILETSLASDTSHVEDPVEGRLASAIVVSHTTVLPAGARVMGSVIDAKQSGRVKGRASLAVRFDRVVVRGEPYHMQTARITRVAAASTKSDIKKGGIGAGVGAVVGGIAGGGKGAAIGGVLGGTGTVLATRGKEVQLPSGATVSTRLTSPLEVRVPVSGADTDKEQ